MSLTKKALDWTIDELVLRKSRTKDEARQQIPGMAAKYVNLLTVAQRRGLIEDLVHELGRRKAAEALLEEWMAQKIKTDWASPASARPIREASAGLPSLGKR